MENRQFTVDPSILFSIINAQAGSLSKALLEAVMNAIDAGASKCAITLDANSFKVADNGRGFQNRTEIESWFERFGEPHVEGDATYGRFRMGRGQLMAFATTDWRTGEFSMAVDVKNRGLTYELKQGLATVKGCHIAANLYKPLQLWELSEVLREIAELVKYAQIPVTVNGKKVSTKPEAVKWDMETDDAWIKIDSSSDLQVYNLGVLVRSYGAYKFGTGGVVVTKIPVQVNFARNDILTSQCAVWPRIMSSLKSVTGTKTLRKASLTESEREFLALRITASELTATEAFNARVITTAVGSQVAISSLLYGWPSMTIAPSKDNRLAERLHRSRTAFVMSSDTLDRFRVSTLAELRDLLIAAIPGYAGSSMPAIVPFEEVAQGYSKLYELVDVNDMREDERMAMRILSTQNRVLGKWLSAEMHQLGETHHELALERRILLGHSDAALAWTDGSTRITIDRRFLRKEARKGLIGWFRILSVLVHEYCHLGLADVEGHSHPLDFYTLYEALMTAENCVVPTLAAKLTLAYGEQMVAAGNKLSRSALSVDSSLVVNTVEVSKAPRKVAAKTVTPDLQYPMF